MCVVCVLYIQVKERTVKLKECLTTYIYILWLLLYIVEKNIVVYCKWMCHNSHATHSTKVSFIFQFFYFFFSPVLCYSELYGWATSSPILVGLNVQLRVYIVCSSLFLYIFLNMIIYIHIWHAAVYRKFSNYSLLIYSVSYLIRLNKHH